MTRRGLDFKRHDDDELWDEVRVKLVPRYKTSGMSGDEWRVSSVLQFLRKGEVLHEQGFRDITTALAFAPSVALTASEGNWYHPDNLCDQPGCDRAAVSIYEIIKEYCTGGGNCGQVLERDGMAPRYRKFCERHLRRGDCGLEDADVNYRVHLGAGQEAQDWTEARISESARVDIRVTSVDEIPGAIQATVDRMREQKGKN